MSLAIPAIEATNVRVTGAVMQDRYRSGPVSRISDHLRSRSQSFTEADIGAPRIAGYDAPLRSVEQGVGEDLEWLQSS